MSIIFQENATLAASFNKEASKINLESNNSESNGINFNSLVELLGDQGINIEQQNLIFNNSNDKLVIDLENIDFSNLNTALDVDIKNDINDDMNLDQYQEEPALLNVSSNIEESSLEDAAHLGKAQALRHSDLVNQYNIYPQQDIIVESFSTYQVSNLAGIQKDEQEHNLDEAESERVESETIENNIKNLNYAFITTAEQSRDNNSFSQREPENIDLSSASKRPNAENIENYLKDAEVSRNSNKEELELSNFKSLNTKEDKENQISNIEDINNLTSGTEGVIKGKQETLNSSFEPQLKKLSNSETNIDIENNIEKIKISIIEMNRLNSSAEKRINIHLAPASLGEIEVCINTLDGQLDSISITSEQNDTLSLLKANSNLLEHSLKEIGITSDNTELRFSLKNDSGSNNNGSNDSHSSNSKEKHQNNYNDFFKEESNDSIKVLQNTNEYYLGIDINI